MPDKNKNQLVVSVLPDQALRLEFENQKNQISRDQAKLQEEIYHNYKAATQPWLFYLGFRQYQGSLSPSLDYFIRFAGCFVRELSRLPELETLRHEVVVDIPKETILEFLSARPMMAGAEYVTAGMLEGLWTGFNQAFSSEIRVFQGHVNDYFHDLNPNIHPAGRVFFHLVENKNQPSPFAFLATFSEGMGANGKPRHLPLKHALETHDEEGLITLLSTVYKAGEKSGIVSDLIHTGELFHPLAWEAGEAFEFLKEIPDYEAAGVICRIPDWWKSAATPKISISLGDKKPSMVGLDALVDFRVGIRIGDLEFSPEAVKKIIEESRGLAFIKNKWVAVAPGKLRQALNACEHLKDLAQSGLTLGEAMRARLNPKPLTGTRGGDVEIAVSSGKWLESVLRKMTQPETTGKMMPGPGFKADLRPYQANGLNWLSFLNAHRFGACLADDMGLGKTVQILGLLSTFKKGKNQGASLLVVPASLISNWEEEIKRFLPRLTIYMAHPGFAGSAGAPKNHSQDLSLSKADIDKHDLVITSYTLVRKYTWLQGYTWRCLVLDEAQAIKNPGTQQTRAIKTLRSVHRIAMTGTPVENRLSDLWSLFDFLNPGLLGSKAEFASFAKTLKDNPDGYATLRQLISPYTLRRLKTDKSVISDLPDKVEMKVFSDLSPKQIVLYKNAVKDLKERIEDTQGIQRKGLVLTSLMRFKQLCNHPDQLTGSGDFKARHSGKFIRLARICETVYEKRERMLVFTQFKEMTEPLRAFLETVFHHPGLVLHGSVPAAKRKQVIDEFQSEAYCPFMVLSLKAGGVGLNLTQANHVVHFDRWWNPAVENQATDRVFRIGQNKKVLVHKFVTRGTIEENIDLMLSEKQDLADNLVAPTGDALVTEMDDTQLMELFRLSLPT